MLIAQAGVAAAVAAAVAINASRAAREAEMREFIANYRHQGATDAERLRYVETVRVMYPPAEKEPPPSPDYSHKLLGVFLVLLFLVPAIGAAYGYFVHRDIDRGLEEATLIAVIVFVAGAMASLFGFGVYLCLS
jgi:hypothetical protein